jgi:hypothetical protein
MFIAQLATKCSRARRPKKILKKIFDATKQKKKTPLVGAAFTLGDADEQIL